MAQLTQRKRLLYVVHRYAPFPGGSENYVRDLAEESRRRGHDVWVFAGEHKGDLNGVKVTSNPKCIFEAWDLIIVHGGDVGIQNYVLSNVPQLHSAVLYLLILPSQSPICLKAMQYVNWIGCSTPADWRHVRTWNAMERSVPIRHSINTLESEGFPGFRKHLNIKTKYMFLSCGGFWPNKAFKELVEVFNKANRQDVTLVLTGYDNRNNIMPETTENVKPYLLEDRRDVLSAIREADLYIMHSHTEGFGLVLLEAMWNYTPWASREIAGAEMMKEYGFTYTNDDQLLEYLKSFQGVPNSQVVHGREYVKASHLTGHTVDDILRLIA